MMPAGWIMARLTAASPRAEYGRLSYQANFRCMPARIAWPLFNNSVGGKAYNHSLLCEISSIKRSILFLLYAGLVLYSKRKALNRFRGGILHQKFLALVFNCIALPFGIGAQQSSQAVLPTGTIDGSLTPESIPDVVAFRLFFSVVAESRRLQLQTGGNTTESSDLVPSDKQKAKLTPARLSESDQAAIATVLAGFKSDLQNVMALPPTLAEQSADARLGWIM